MDKNAMFKLSYGLFVLSTNSEGVDNACIINTAMQVTDTPLQISITVNKNNYTTELIAKSRKFCVSTLTERASMEIFKRFGFASGRNGDKFQGFESVARSENGMLYLANMANAYIEGEVESVIDLGTHYTFVAKVIGANILNNDNSLTYDYYSKNIKPKPQAVAKNSYVCSVCGYVYEGESLPSDFVCPLCKHGADAFTLQKASK